MPTWLIPLRDAVYNQEANSDRIMARYREARSTAIRTLNRVPRYLALSRGEYLLGLHYWHQGRELAAALRFTEGAALAREALTLFPTAGGWCALAENTLHLGLVQGMDERAAWDRVEAYARNALALDRQNARARYLAAARGVYAPAHCNDPRQGMELMEELLLSRPASPDPALLFDIYLAAGYGYFQQKRYPAAEDWWKKAEALYPDNQQVQNLRALLPPRSGASNAPSARQPDAPSASNAPGASSAPGVW
jgi:tetratricopeptide (TPR) repeat protein